MPHGVAPVIGDKFGYWTYLETIRKGSVKFFLCRCKCDSEVLVRPWDIAHGKSFACRKCSPQNTPTPMIGKKFGTLTVLRKSDKEGSRHLFYDCLCDCGQLRTCNGSDLRLGKVKRCIQCRKDLIVTHYKTKTPMYEVWLAIKQRCNNPNNKSYSSYGGRGIKLCERWLDFSNFYIDMGERPDGLQIDRINNNGNYEPTNCRWVTSKENNNNRRVRKCKIKT